MSEPEVYIAPPELEECHPDTGWILIKPDDMEDRTTGGLLIGRDPSKPHNMTGIRTGLVLEVGPPQASQAPKVVEAGDTALFAKGANIITVHIGGEQHFLMQYAQVIGKCVPCEVKYVVPQPEPELVIAQEVIGGNGGLPRPVR